MKLKDMRLQRKPFLRIADERLAGGREVNGFSSDVNVFTKVPASLFGVTEVNYMSIFLFLSIMWLKRNEMTDCSGL